MISHKHKCIFVHIPRCGGSSIEDIIWPNESDRTEDNLWMGFVSEYRNKHQTGGLQHLLARQIRKEVGAGIFDEHFKFSIVRNPWDKAVSQYLFMKRREDLREYIGMRKRDKFKKYLSLIQKKEHAQWKPQHLFLENGEGNVLVDFIGKFENYVNCARSILLKLQIDGIYEIPHKNKSRRTHYRDYYDSESKEMVREIYKQDIARFGYEF